MESFLIWSLACLVSALIVLPYLLKVRRMHRENISRKQEAHALGIDRPIAQYPFIDELRCIGCGSCVSACPEGDVLGVVYGKAQVINGLRCVGHGLCERACPVGAIQVGLGDIRQREDIPILDEFNETSVPGIFIAGELGGFSLIKNAIAHGKLVVGKIARDGNRSRNAAIKDVVIVGAGPAGLSSALSCEEAGLSYVVVDQQDAGGTILQYPRRKLVMTQPAELPLYGRLKKSEYSKEELLGIWLEIISQYRIPVQTHRKVVDVHRNNGHFALKTNAGNYLGRYVVLAMGRRGTPRKLSVPGEEKPKVMYQLIDAQSYRDCDILVVGGGDSAVEAALGLARQKDNQVYISYRKSKFFRIKKKNEERIRNQIDKGRVTALFNSQVLEIGDKTVRLTIEGRDKEIPNDYVFVFIGGEPPFQLLKKIGIAFGGDQAAPAVAAHSRSGVQKKIGD